MPQSNLGEITIEKTPNYFEVEVVPERVKKRSGVFCAKLFSLFRLGLVGFGLGSLGVGLCRHSLWFSSSSQIDADTHTKVHVGHVVVPIKSS